MRYFMLLADSGHIIVCGTVNDKVKLERFFKEFFHPNRTSVNDYRALILSPLEPSDEFKAMLVSPIFDSKVSYLIGSALNSTDLMRVKRKLIL